MDTAQLLVAKVLQKPISEVFPDYNLSHTDQVRAAFKDSQSEQEPLISSTDQEKQVRYLLNKKWINSLIYLALLAPE